MKGQQLGGAALYCLAQTPTGQQGDPPAGCSAGAPQPPSSSLKKALIVFLRPCSPLENPLFLSFLQGHCTAVEKSMALLGGRRAYASSSTEELNHIAL